MIKFPENKEKPGRWLGIDWKHGDHLTYKILPDNPEKDEPYILTRSVIEPDDEKNIRCNTERTIGWKNYRKRTTKGYKGKRRSPRLAKLKKTEEGISDSESDDESDDEDKIEEIPSKKLRRSPFEDDENFMDKYSHIDKDLKDSTIDIEEENEDIPMIGKAAAHIEKLKDAVMNANLDEEDDQLFKVEKIIDHKLNEKNKPILYIQWDKNGTDFSWESFSDIKADEPLMVAEYIVKNDVRRDKRFQHTWARRLFYKIKLLYKSMIYNDRITVRNVKASHVDKNVMYGIRIPRNAKEAIQFDKENGNTFWQNAIQNGICNMVSKKEMINLMMRIKWKKSHHKN